MLLNNRKQNSQNFVLIFQSSILEEGAVVLKLEPFPHEWIINTINREVDSGWAHEIIEMLEQEAKKAGKI